TTDADTSANVTIPKTKKNTRIREINAPACRSHLSRHPPDDGLVEAKIATFDGFWQFQTLDTGLSCSQPATLAAGRRKCRICCHPDAPLPWVSLERMTIKDFTRVLDQAAAAVPRSAAGCRQTNFSGWRPRPFGMRRNDRGSRPWRRS